MNEENKISTPTNTPASDPWESLSQDELIALRAATVEESNYYKKIYWELAREITKHIDDYEKRSDLVYEQCDAEDMYVACDMKIDEIDSYINAK